MASEIFEDKAKFCLLVESDLIYTLLLLIEFILIRSPNNAPPVFLFVGSTDKIANFLVLKSLIKRLTSSSTNEDLPAPPVPVIPTTNVSEFFEIEFILLNNLL